jgi:hypothetical protein
LAEVGLNVTARLDELNVDKLVATSDTIKSLKSLRAELTKELSGFEAQRKEIKAAVANPYLEFEDTYKVEVSEKYKGAISTLKDKIGDFENKVKQEKKDEIQSYFAELCLDADIDFLKFADTKIEVNISISVKKYKEQCQEFVSKVQDDIKLIASTAFEAEIMTEYKKTLNASHAITDTQKRKEDERLEAERIKLNETNRRGTLLRGMAMTYSDLIRAFVFVSDNSIFIEDKDVEELSKDEFNKRYVELEAKIKAKTIVPKPTPSVQKTDTPAAAPKPEVLKAPKVIQEVVKEKIFKATFECTGTMSELKALGAYMKNNNIIYKNLKK